MIFKSASARGEPIYRVQLKKAILANIDSLRLLEQGNLPSQDPLINLVLDALDESKNGLIDQKELKQAVRKIANDNDIVIDNEQLVQMVEAVYMNDDGAEAAVTRNRIRAGL